MEVNWGNVESYSEVQSVNGLTGKVQLNIPTKTSDLVNDSNFATKAELKEVENKIPNVSNFATKSDVSNSISVVEAKIPSVSNFATTSYVETAITNKGYQTQIQVQALINDAISNIKNANEVSY